MIARFAIAFLSVFFFNVVCLAAPADSVSAKSSPAASSDSVSDFPDDLLSAADSASLASDIMPAESQGFHKVLKTKFIEGDASFMSLVALVFVIGLAFCIERIIYLSMSEINAKKFMADLSDKVEAVDI